MAVDAGAVTIDELLPEHWPGVARVYAEGIATGNATFETKVPPWRRWDDVHLPDHRFVALQGGEVIGWVAVVAISDRCVYGGVVEHSVYVAEAARGQGIGQRLLEHVIASTEAAGIWTIQTGILRERGQRSPARAGRLRGRRAAQAPRKAEGAVARRPLARTAKRDDRLMDIEKSEAQSLDPRGKS